MATYLRISLPDSYLVFGYRIKCEEFQLFSTAQNSKLYTRSWISNIFFALYQIFYQVYARTGQNIRRYVTQKERPKDKPCVKLLRASRPTLVSAAFNENYDVTTSARCSAAQRGASGVAARTTAQLGLGGARAAERVGSVVPQCAPVASMLIRCVALGGCAPFSTTTMHIVVKSPDWFKYFRIVKLLPFFKSMSTKIRRI